MSSKENLKYAMSLLTMYQTELAMFKCFVPCLVPQSCPTLCDLTDYSPPGSSVLGILQARILEWVTMSSSRGSSQPRDRTHISNASCIDG